MGESSKFTKSELKKFKSQNLIFAYKLSILSSLNGLLSLGKKKINERSYYNLPNSGF